ncbi:MAG: ATP-dependent acyl-CoA ligase [Phenylobacterium sp.]|uniref:AMP-binding protein n=1 Tax=Phenylobacterium sp. TaxID=1871053 RepID=UPI00121466B6|nr:AMP-binding protein [Phenylobacterium sp.]TAJ72765.1 MAG: ATP-dependent acyl-CoA ligase [Phenylobacterium sp.]
MPAVKAESHDRTPDVSLIATLLDQARHTPDKTYVTSIDGRSLSYAETVAGARLWAAAYRRAGVQPGEHVVTMQHNTLESLLGWLGLAWLGAVEAPINSDYRGPLLAHALNLTRAPTMLVLDRFADRVAEVSGDLQHLRTLIVLDGDRPAGGAYQTLSGAAFLENLDPATDLRAPAPWDIMAVLFTSGTTGPSKAVRIPWAQMHAMVTGSFKLEDFGHDEVIYNAGPTYHVGAKVFPYMAGLVGGRHLMRPFISRSAVAEEYLRFGVTVGGVVADWLDQPPQADDATRPLRFLLTPYRDPAAEPFVARFGGRRFGVFNMTEVSCPIQFRDWDAVVYDAAGRMSCGVVRDGYEARVVDANDQPVPDGEVGELIIRADRPWVLNAGYLNNPEATAEAWRNGWFHTGDAFVRDTAGNFFFLDRLKDSIRRHGENISSFEVEAYVNAHPAVALSAAVAVKASAHAGASEEIKIVVERLPGEALDAETLIRWLIPQMPRFMVPRYVEFIDALPLTPTQKVRKKVLRDDGVGPRTWDREAAGIEVPR